MDALLEAIFITLLPVFELRGGIPYALYKGIDPLTAFVVMTIANILITVPVFIFLDHLNTVLLRSRHYKKFFEHVVVSTRKSAKPYLDKYGFLGLAVFVGVPLPMTGAYTGTLAAWLFGMGRKRSFLAISLGVVAAGIIVTIVSYYGISTLSIFTKT